MNIITKITSSYGKYFQFGLRNESKIESDISTYSYYLNNNDNQKVPIVKVENFEIKSVSNQFWIPFSSEKDHKNHFWLYSQLANYLL